MGGDKSETSSDMLLIPSNTKLKNFLVFFFLPITLPFILYNFVEKFRKRFGFKKRRLEGKVVVITGASSGIGESLAKILYSSGCRLILASRRIEELERVRNELVRTETYGPVYVPAIVQVDLEDKDGIPDKASTITQIYGYVDILINNAGISYRGSVLDTTFDVDQKLMNVNYFGPLMLTREIIKDAMLKKKNGKVVFVSSIQGKISIPFRSCYSASKHALQALSDSLRAELKEDNISVLVVNPGYVKTNLSINAITGSGSTYGKMDETTAKGHSPKYIANKILDAILEDKNEITIATMLPKIAIYLRTIAPFVYFWLMAKRAKNAS